MLRTKSIAFIGLGRMGFEMAANLFSKQYQSTNDARFLVCDALPDAAIAFRNMFIAKYPAANISIADDPNIAAAESATIITMLPSSPQVLSLYSNNIIPTLASLKTIHYTLCIDSTTLDVDIARQVASLLTDTGASVVDAPVSGGVTGAKAATLSFLVGGTDHAFKRAHPILSLMGKRIIHCGPSGAGLAAKISNNLVLGVQQIVVAEAMLLGQSLGLDPAILASVINSSTGSCWSCSVNNPVPFALPDKSPPCQNDYNGGFATSLMLKDMALATHIADNQHTPLPLGRAAHDIYQRVVSDRPELARKDFSSVYQYLKTNGI